MSEESDNHLSRREFLVYSTAVTVAASGLVARTDAMANQDPHAPGATFINDGSHTIYGYS
ncbi:twin-arginine translocation signal domain-containing protein [Rubinisphaera margarita]|uniref:twin-arginine translocation signal domain-containing protein n=1 Tax=Rubinisphaera margarita TaxID=2909586 RepID=UPI001EE80D16|nr:twin-arginine translocation signal domain-containing protein [Rubinisphaera margarita]MCG6156259.1 twin-arginine translocation signal domain-containing protein [Rubinisphaera margarita]